MKNRNKQFACLLLAAVLLAGCAAPDGGSQAAVDESTFDYGDATVTHYWNDASHEVNMDTDIAAALQDKAGVDVVYLKPESGNVLEGGISMRAMLQAGIYPDIITCERSNAILQQMISAGAVTDIHTLMDSYAPGMAERFAPEFYRNYQAQDKKNYYWVDAIWTQDALNHSDLDVVQDDFVTTNVRSDLYRAIGSPSPKNQQEYKQMLEDLLALDPSYPVLILGDYTSQNGLFYPGNTPAYGFFAQWGLQRYEVNSGTVQSIVRSEEFVDMVRWTNELYTDGLIAIDTFTDNEETYARRIATGQTVAYIGAVGGFGLEEGVEYTPVGYFEVPGQQAAFTRGNYDEMVTVVTTGANQEQAMKWLDYLSSDEGRVLAGRGIEGVHWQSGAHGPERTEQWNDMPDMRHFISQWGFLQNNALQDYYNGEILFMNAKADGGANDSAFRQYVQVDEFEGVRFDDLSDEDWLAQAKLNELFYTYYPQMVMAETPELMMEHYEAFMAECQTEGLDELEAAWKRAYQRTQS